MSLRKAPNPCAFPQKNVSGKTCGRITTTHSNTPPTLKSRGYEPEGTDHNTAAVYGDVAAYTDVYGSSRDLRNTNRVVYSDL